MKARLYAKTGSTPKAQLKGQAARVWEEIRREPELATTIDERIAKSATPHKTRQDSFRVTLYYILVFKKQGLVAAHEQVEATEDIATEVEADTEDVAAEASEATEDAATE